MKILAGSIVATLLLVLSGARVGRAPRADVRGDDSVKPPADENLGASQSQAAREPLRLPLVEPRVVVSKGARKLELYSGGRVVRTYRVGLGLSPVEDKERAGDRRTPEGDFYVCVKNAKSNFYLSLGLSYPNREDAERGLRDRLITHTQYERILRSLSKTLRPPWDTPLGGEIFIHGGGSSSDWTWGCVALENEDIKELFDALPLKTPVRIEH
jgi:murein L,D-transpeptidase YafK